MPNIFLFNQCTCKEIEEERRKDRSVLSVGRCVFPTHRVMEADNGPKILGGRLVIRATYVSLLSFIVVGKGFRFLLSKSVIFIKFCLRIKCVR